VGGALNEAVLAEDDATLVRIAREQIGPLLGITAEPLFARVNRYPRAMPQYLVGHAARAEAIEQSVARLPGLRLAGGGYRGVGIADCVRSGEEAAEALMDGAKSGGGG
jgi:oxygen-dependent protoporphyrinogen oxidase